VPFTSLQHLLDANHVKYARISHAPAFTARETAASAHICGHEFRDRFPDCEVGAMPPFGNF
jgi:hypothetical protein